MVVIMNPLVKTMVDRMKENIDRSRRLYRPCKTPGAEETGALNQAVPAERGCRTPQTPRVEEARMPVLVHPEKVVASWVPRSGYHGYYRQILEDEEGFYVE
jgi:hypothetical protein